MRRTLLGVFLILVLAIPCSIYVLAATSEGQPNVNPEDSSNLTTFTAVVNAMRNVSVEVPVDIDDGVTREEAEVITEITFTTVMGPNRVHHVESLTLTGDQLIAHATWGYDANDLSHVFHMIVDFTTRQITVSHCF